MTLRSRVASKITPDGVQTWTTDGLEVIKYPGEGSNLLFSAEVDADEYGVEFRSGWVTPEQAAAWGLIFTAATDSAPENPDTTTDSNTDKDKNDA